MRHRIPESEWLMFCEFVDQIELQDKQTRLMCRGLMANCKDPLVRFAVKGVMRTRLLSTQAITDSVL